MITRLEFENFRGLKQVTLDELRSVNLIVGGNDTGKTSVLEGLILLLGDYQSIGHLPVTFRTNQSGGNSSENENDRENFWPWLFFDRDTTSRVTIRGRMDTNDEIAVNTVDFIENYINAPKLPMLTRKHTFKREQVNPNKHGGAEQLVLLKENSLNVSGGSSPGDFRLAVLSTRPTSPVQDAENYNRVALKADGEKRIEQIMREVEPRVKRLRYGKLPRTTSPLIYTDLGLSHSVPSTQMGQAFNRILHIYTNILADRINVLLVDEIENGIFSESMLQIWKGLFAICKKEGVQIFATTHSRECVMAAHQAAAERGEDELSVQRLQLVNGQVEAVRMGAEHLDVAAEMGLEVRS